MKMKDIWLMGLGAGMVIMYNMYNEPIKKALKEKMLCTARELENMM